MQMTTEKRAQKSRYWWRVTTHILIGWNFDLTVLPYHGVNESTKAMPILEATPQTSKENFLLVVHSSRRQLNHFCGVLRDLRKATKYHARTAKDN